MDPEKMLPAVRNDRIQFATYRPPRSAFALLERRVIVTGPPELASLSTTGDLKVLEGLRDLLSEPDRAWAAEVLLAALTGREAQTVDAFSGHPDQWWESVGQSAHERWTRWLDETRDRLIWDAENNTFVEAA